MVYLASRFASFLILLLVLTFFSVSLQRMRGGSAGFAASGQSASAREIAKIDKYESMPFTELFLKRLPEIITLDFGLTTSNEPVMPRVFSSFRYTLVLAFLAAFFALIYGIITGVTGHYHTVLRKHLTRLNAFFLANPVFIISILFIWIFSIALNLLPPGGTTLNGWYVLPSLALGLKAGSRLSVFIDEYYERELTRPYVITHISYGINRMRLYYWLILKNLLLPAISFWLLDFASYLAGAAIIETIHSIPGTGSLLVKALYSYDLNLVMGILVFTSVLVFSVGIVQDQLDRYYRRFTGER